MKNLIFPTLCLTLCACASPRTFTQSGAVAGSSNAAKIICDSDRDHTVLNGLNHKVFIARVDRKSTSTLTGFMTDTAPYAEYAWVTPGRHYLDLNYTYMNSFAWGQVWFDAEAGKTYVIRKQIAGYSVRFWVEEAETGKVAGGIPGGEPENQAQPAPTDAYHRDRPRFRGE